MNNNIKNVFSCPQNSSYFDNDDIHSIGLFSLLLDDDKRNAFSGQFLLTNIHICNKTTMITNKTSILGSYMMTMMI